MKKEYEKLQRKDATHNLECCHCVSPRSCYDYSMDCIILKEMLDNRLKILVFGDRYWKGYDDKKRIRYVHRSKVKEKNK